MRCVVCEKPLENIDHVLNQPSGGIEFVTEGHYGTTVFDPMDGSKLAVNICDPCLTRAIAAGNTITYPVGK